MADEKLTQLSATTTIQTNALFYVVQDVSTTPVSQKVVFSDLKSAINTGGSSGGLTLVQAQILSAGNTDLTFSSLNGNTDVMYRAMGVLKIGASTTTIDLRINGATTNLSWLRLYNGGNDGVANFLASGNSGAYLTLDLAILAKANPNSQSFARFARGHGIITDTTPALLFIIEYAIQYNDTSTNITSIGFHADQTGGIANGSYMNLYKYAQS